VPTTIHPGRQHCSKQRACSARDPQPATIIFASFTGEEAGLLGSREFVRQAKADSLKFVGALNNDMLGWSNDNRLDNTIRYSNAGIRDVQHAAAFLFTRMITYDAFYYKSTDAAAFYDGYWRHRGRHRLISGAGQPALPHAARHA
jgi:Zn-dependent M28 family amino/carboxypeptidase